MRKAQPYIFQLHLLISAVILYLTCHSALVAQTPDSRGTDFFLTFLPNEHTSDLLEVEDRDSLYIFIRAAEFPTRGTITYRNSLGNTTVSPFVITGPPGMYTFARFWEDCELETVSSARIRPQSIQITTDRDVTVYALNHALTSSDATLVFPTDALGNRYRVMSYPSNPGYGTPSQCAVIATRNNTRVTFTLSTPIVGRPETTFDVTLQEGEVYVLQARIPGDLTGTLVESTEPVALCSGHLRTLLPLASSSVNSRDHLLEQIPPISVWSKSYLLTPFPQPPDQPRNDAYDLVRVLAAYDDTDIFIDGKPKAQLNAGEFYETRLFAASLLMSSKAVLVAQYGHTSSKQPGKISSGDPFMLIVPSRHQFLRSYQTVSVQATVSNYMKDLPAYTYQYCTILCQTDDIGSMKIDEQLVPSALFKRIASTCYSYAWVELTDGAHTIRADKPFGLHMYGYGTMDSYGYTAGMNFTTVAEEPITISADTIICVGDTVQLHATGGQTYQWSPPDGLNCTDCPNPLASPERPTHYTVHIDDDFGCTSDFSVFVDVQPYPVAGLDSAVSICPGKSTTLRAPAGRFYTWSPAAGLSCTNCANPVASPLSTTVYTVVISNGATCSTVDSIKVVVESFVLKEAPGDTLMCAGDSIAFNLPTDYRYNWFPATGLSCDTCSNPVASPHKTTKYTIVVRNPEGCRFTTTVTITVIDLPIVSVSPDVVLCEHELPVRLLAKGGNFYRWSPADGLSCSDCASPLAKPVQSTTYTVHISINGSCETVTTVTVSVLPAPVPIVSRDTLICPSTAVQLTASGGTVYTWSPAQTLSCADCPEPVARPIETTTYHVWITNDEGCTVRDSIRVTVRRPTDISLVTMATICAGDSISLTATGGTLYHWAPPDGLSCTDCPSPLASPRKTTVYTLTIDGESNCPEQRRISVEVLPRPEVTLGPDTTICRGEQAYLHARGDGIYTWWPTTDLNCTDCSSPVATPLVSTRYYVTLQNGICSSMDSVLVTVRACDLDATFSGNDFGSIALCDSAAEQCILTNIGLDSIEILGWQMTGTDAESFDVQLSDISFPYTLAPEASLYFPVVCHPRREGSLSARLVVQTRDENFTPSALCTATAVKGRIVFTLGSDIRTAPGSRLYLDIQAHSDNWSALRIDNLEFTISYKSAWLRYGGEILRGPASDSSWQFAAYEQNNFDGSHQIVVTAVGSPALAVDGTIATIVIEPLLANELIYTPDFASRAIGREACTEIESYSPTLDISFCAAQLRPVRINNMKYSFELPGGAVVLSDNLQMNYSVGLQADVQIGLYNQLGELVVQESHSHVLPGQYDKIWNISHLATGMYILHFSSGPFSKSIPLFIGAE